MRVHGINPSEPSTNYRRCLYALRFPFWIPLPFPSFPAVPLSVARGLTIGGTPESAECPPGFCVVDRARESGAKQREVKLRVTRVPVVQSVGPRLEMPWLLKLRTRD